MKHFNKLRLIIGFALLVAVGVYFGAKLSDSGKAEKCRSNIALISRSLALYALDNDGVLPPLAYDADGVTVQWDTIIFPYIKSKSVYICPNSTGDICSYVLNPFVAGKSINRIPDRRSTILVYEGNSGSMAFPHHGRGSLSCFPFAEDGTIEFSSDKMAALVTKQESQAFTFSP